MTPELDDDAPLDPRGALDLIETQTREVAHASRRAVPWFYFSWGPAWLIGYLLLWAAFPDSGSPVTVPWMVAIPVFLALVAAAIVISTVVGARIYRGIRGRSAFEGLVYGLSWPLMFGAYAALGWAMTRAGMPGEVAAIYYPSAYALVIAPLYLAGALLWRSADQLVLAIVMLVAGSVSPFFGAPANYLVLGLIAGGTLLIAGVVTAVQAWTRR